MFTGIIEEIGTVAEVSHRQGMRLAIEAARVLEELKVGDSIAVSGPCLTVEELDERRFWASLLPETAAQTTLAAVQRGARVNLERALRLGDRLGGHLVAGHVDAIAEVTAVTPRGQTRLVQLRCPEPLARYLVDQGSVALDGVSLTVREPVGREFAVSLVGTTLEATTLGQLRPGDRVNMEADMLAKHVEKLIGAREGTATSEALMSWLESES